MAIDVLPNSTIDPIDKLLVTEVLERETNLRVDPERVKFEKDRSYGAEILVLYPGESRWFMFGLIEVGPSMAPGKWAMSARSQQQFRKLYQQGLATIINED